MALRAPELTPEPTISFFESVLPAGSPTPPVLLGNTISQGHHRSVGNTSGIEASSKQANGIVEEREHQHVKMGFEGGALAMDQDNKFVPVVSKDSGLGVRKSVGEAARDAWVRSLRRRGDGGALLSEA